MSHLTRRSFLGTAVSAVALGLTTGRAGAAERPAKVPATAKGPRPLPELVPDSDLPVYELDVEATRRKRWVVLRDGRKVNSSPQGCVVQIAAGAEIPLNWWGWYVKGNLGYVSGARLILRGDREKPPKLIAGDRKGLMSVQNTANIPVGFELENLHLEAGQSGAALRPVSTRFVRLSGVTVTGGKNGVFIPPYRTHLVIEDSEIRHGGRGDGRTHCIYINYIESVTARRSRFHSANAQGHAFKCYSAYLDMRECLVASWLTKEDRHAGFYGELPPVDLGAWADTVLAENVFIRRSPTRQVCLDYRNRQFAKGKSKWRAPDWGTEVVDPGLVDNRDDDNPYLFRHLLVGNRFLNGVLPDETLDPGIRSNPGFAVRNNGSGPWGSHGKVEAKVEKPRGWQRHQERSVIWAASNRFEGVPFELRYQTAPNKRPDDFAPIRETEGLPGWASL